MVWKILFFYVYQFHELENLLWESLVDKYIAKDAHSKEFLVSNVSAYKMVDNHSIIDQFHELQRMHTNMKINVTKLYEIYIVSSIIDKLPPSWRDVRHALNHKKEEISLFHHGQHIVVESSIRALESQKHCNPYIVTINMVKDEGRSSHGE